MLINESSTPNKPLPRSLSPACACSSSRAMIGEVVPAVARWQGQGTMFTLIGECTMSNLKYRLFHSLMFGVFTTVVLSACQSTPVTALSASPSASLRNESAREEQIISAEVSRAQPSQAGRRTNTSQAMHCLPAQVKFDCDRQAILAMVGEYQVDFNFEEVASFRDDYSLQPSYHSKGFETIFVVEDSGTRIVLQHILVSSNGHVTKHWRQDWQFQPSTIWRYDGVQAEQSWQQTRVSDEQAQGQWLQSVWQVDDSPRYAGLGRWQYEGNTSVWISDITPRPLPRREHSTRSDYDVLVAQNRQEITATGWTHLQDNLKLDSTAESARRYLAREFGVNRYTRITTFDFTPAYDYWTRTQAFWRDVRQAWTEQLNTGARLILRPEVEGKSLWLTLFTQAELAQQNDTENRPVIDAILDRFLQREWQKASVLTAK